MHHLSKSSLNNFHEADCDTLLKHSMDIKRPFVNQALTSVSVSTNWMLVTWETCVGYPKTVVSILNCCRLHPYNLPYQIHGIKVTTCLILFRSLPQLNKLIKWRILEDVPQQGFLMTSIYKLIFLQYIFLLYARLKQNKNFHSKNVSQALPDYIPSRCGMSQ